MPRITKAQLQEHIKELNEELEISEKLYNQAVEHIQELRTEFEAYRKLHVDTDLCEHRQAPCAWAQKLTAEREAALDEVAALKVSLTASQPSRKPA